MITNYFFQINVCEAFRLKCPETAQWKIRAKSHCPDPSKYSCLRNVLEDVYTENCTISDFLRPGKIISLKRTLKLRMEIGNMLKRQQPN